MLMPMIAAMPYMRRHAAGCYDAAAATLFAILPRFSLPLFFAALLRCCRRHAAYA